MKMQFVVLAGATALGLMLAGCATHSVPLPPDEGASAMPVAQPGEPSETQAATEPVINPAVQIYFAERQHPGVLRQLGRVSRAARVARRGNGSAVQCDEALAAALDKLRIHAREKGANAVINVKTYFHGIENDSATKYTCNLSARAAVVDVKGDLVVLQAQ